MWTTPQFAEDGTEKTVVMSRRDKFVFDSEDRKTHKDRLRIRKESSIHARRIAKTQRKANDEDPVQTQALKLLDVLSDTNQAVSGIIEKTAKQTKMTKMGVEKEQHARGTRLPLDKALTATIEFTNECHHYVLNFPEMPITCMLRIDVRRRLMKGPEVHVYVAREPVPTPSSFEWHFPCESSLVIDPEDPRFHHGLYWITVYSMGKSAEYTIHCRSMVYRESKSTDHDKTAVKLLGQNIKRRIAKSEEIRVDSQKELKKSTEKQRRKSVTILDTANDFQLHEKFQHFEWLQSTMEPYDLKSRAISVKNYHFNPVRMRDALVQIQEALTDDSTAKKRYSNAAVDPLQVCEIFLSESFKSFPRYRPTSALTKRSASPSSPNRTISPSRSRPSTAFTPKTPKSIEASRQKPSDRRIVLLTSKGQMPASYLGRLRSDADDFRTHSFDRLYFKLSNSGAMLQSASEEDEGETIFEVKEILAADAVTLPDQPSTFFCFKLLLPSSNMTFAAFSSEDRDKWLRAAVLFCTAEKSVAGPSGAQSAGKFFGDRSPISPSRHAASPAHGLRFRTSPQNSPMVTPAHRGGSSPVHRKSLRPSSAAASAAASPASHFSQSAAPTPMAGANPTRMPAPILTLPAERRKLGEPVTPGGMASRGSSVSWNPDQPQSLAQTVAGDVHPRRPFSASPLSAPESEAEAAARHRRPATAMQ